MSGQHTDRPAPRGAGDRHLVQDGATTAYVTKIQVTDREEYRDSRPITAQFRDLFWQARMAAVPSPSPESLHTGGLRT